MKWFFNQCRPHRQSICLLAAGALPEGEKDKVEDHLAVCPDCRTYHAELTQLAAPLANWERNFARLEPGQAVRMRWAEAVQVANKQNPIRQHARLIALLDWGYDVIWPCRRIWAGFAAVWIVILVVNSSMRDNSQSLVAKSSRPSPEKVAAFLEHEGLLAELIKPREIRVAEPPKPTLPPPRSQRRIETLAT